MDAGAPWGGRGPGRERAKLDTKVDLITATGVLRDTGNRQELMPDFLNGIQEKPRSS